MTTKSPGERPSLDPDVIKDIDAQLADLTDPKEKSKFRQRLIRKAVADARYSANFQAAYDEAIKNRYPDPLAHAKAVAGQASVLERASSKLGAVDKRVESTTIKRYNRMRTRLEDAKVSLSKVAKKPIRKTPQKDKQYIDIIGEAQRFGYLANKPLVLSKLSAVPRLRSYRLSCWEKTSANLKVMAQLHEMAKLGAVTINLRLSEKVLEQALSSKRGAAPYMQDRIRKEFVKAFGFCPMFLTALECGRHGSYHIHGAVVLPDHTDAKALADQALRKAGGGWDDVKAAYKQQLSTPLKDPFYWASYVLKAINVTRQKLYPDEQDAHRKTYASSLELKKLAEIGWDDLRATLPQPGLS